jgi:exodeoxyribonuclease VII large subunit
LTQPLKLSELTRSIQRTIESSFADQTYWVIADVTNHTFKFSSTVHYFDLVEKDRNSSAILARVQVRAWGNASNKISKFEKESGQKFENNINVLVLVSVNFSPSYGLQLSLHDIDPVYTLGHFERERKITLANLLLLNPAFIYKIGDTYRTRNADLKLRIVIQRIAVITSDTSAGYEDFTHALETNAFGYNFSVDKYYTMVQGEANARTFIGKLVEIYKSKIDYDVVAIVRGGGAQTDFLIFDNYQLARAIAKFPIPILTGIGHHKNLTLSDLMAHTVTNTPTKVAEFVLAHNRVFEDKLIHAQKQILIKTQQIFSLHNSELNGIRSGLLKNVFQLLNGHGRRLMNLYGVISSSPKLILNNKKKGLALTKASVLLSSKALLSKQNDRIRHFSSLVRIMSPQNILNKGFAILKVGDRIISNSEDIPVGSALNIQMAREELLAKVITKKIL